jgi:hypothetical protein
MRNYDTWLQRPYQERAEENDAFVSFCEANDLDPDDPASEQAYEQDRTDRQEERAERLAEERADAELDYEPGYEPNYDY